MGLQPRATPETEIKKLSLPDFASPAQRNQEAAIPFSTRNVQLDLRIELGRTYINPEDAQKLSEGSIVPLDQLTSDPVDIFVNGRLIARGEVLVVDDHFCVRIAELRVPRAAA
jgi:flagellar motor switch protein FliN